MKMTEYVGNARAALNQWAETHLPGGDIWSEDISESYRIFRHTTRSRVAAYSPVIISCVTGYLAGLTLQDPNYVSATLLALSIGVGGLSIKTIRGARQAYERIGQLIERGALTTLILNAGDDEFIRKTIGLYVQDHRLQDEYDAAQIFVEVTTREPSFG